MGLSNERNGIYGPVITSLPSKEVDTTGIGAHGKISPLATDIDGNVRPWSLVWGKYGRKRPKRKLKKVIDVSAVIPK